MPFSTVSDALYGRLTDADVESVVAAMDADDQELVRRVGTDRAEYHRTILHRLHRKLWLRARRFGLPRSLLFQSAAS